MTEIIAQAFVSECDGVEKAAVSDVVLDDGRLAAARMLDTGRTVGAVLSGT